MKRSVILAAGLTVAAALAVTGVALGPATGAGGKGAPPFLLHVHRYSGGISNGVRAQIAAQALARPAAIRVGRVAAPAAQNRNVRMNTDSTPPYPQNETSVAYNAFNPMIAVVAANDYVDGGFWIGHTTNGGRTWSSTFRSPESFLGKCFGSDPSVVFSRRDRAFYLATLCFTLTDGLSEIHVWKSVDNGRSWTPSALASVPISNIVLVGTDTLAVDLSVFYDKELLAVDNTPGSPFYGRLYMTYVKFHYLPDGFSDYCPLQVAYTDLVPTEAPIAAIWTNVAVLPDDPEGLGVGEGANQGASPVVDSAGGLDIAYLVEECNTGVDTGIRFVRSTDGGDTYSAPVAVDKPGQWADIPNPDDLLPHKNARIPSFPSMVFNPRTTALDMIYMNLASPGSGANISFQRSTDFGATWSDARTISTRNNQPAPHDQFFPALAVDERGGLHAIWFDNRNDRFNVLIETWQAYSGNDGRTWRQWKISTRAWDPNDSFFDSGEFIGDYNWIAASTKVVYPTWTDGRSSDGVPNGETDVFTNVEIGGIR